MLRKSRRRDRRWLTVHLAGRVWLFNFTNNRFLHYFQFICTVIVFLFAFSWFGRHQVRSFPLIRIDIDFFRSDSNVANPLSVWCEKKNGQHISWCLGVNSEKRISNSIEIRAQWRRRKKNPARIEWCLRIVCECNELKCVVLFFYFRSLFFVHFSLLFGIRMFACMESPFSLKFNVTCTYTKKVTAVCGPE